MHRVLKPLHNGFKMLDAQLEQTHSILFASNRRGLCRFIACLGHAAQLSDPPDQPLTLAHNSPSMRSLGLARAGRIAPPLLLGHLANHQRTALDLLADQLELRLMLLLRSLARRLPRRTAMGGHRSPSLPARDCVVKEIRCVGEENLTSYDTARSFTVAPRHPDEKRLYGGACETVASAASRSVGTCLRSRSSMLPTARPRTAPPHPNPMSESDDRAQPATGTTEITLVTGDRHRVEGDAKDVERTILDAARGSLMELAWLVEADTRNDLAVNPAHVVLLRAPADEAATT